MEPELALVRELLADADLLESERRHRSTVSRAYYAAYHACVALMESFNLKPSNFIGRGGRPATRWEHGIVATAVVADGRLRAILTPAVARQVAWLYLQRIRGDYRPRETVSALGARTSGHLAAQVVSFVEGHLDAQGS